MAQRRMFSIDELQADDFLELTPQAQILYVQLSLNADDDGFTSRVKMTQRLCGATNDDLDSLRKNGFVHIFENGVSVIMNWNANNQIKKDRYHETTHRDEKDELILNDSGWYKLKEKPDYDLNGYSLDTNRIQAVSNKDTKCNQNGDNLGTQIVKEVKGSEFRKFSKVSQAIGEDSPKGEPTKSRKSVPTSKFITDELITEVLKHNNNDVNKATLEFLDSDVPIDSFGDRIHELSKKISEQQGRGSNSKITTLPPQDKNVARG
ncbi:hypothetical protein [Liquorilactobacillus satsumensis]|uniref:Phage replication initiation protein n=1 Tax=Liquorilactobacillus satsumensis DSM 16230 = JCM 12392 TaxID=1423801 RepID=A0A0R1V2L9_9LACO|nr:hypothetical protein [Liquorilactobacillus satsumensis]KRL99766.1 hypothetical protein FD50_GL000088 [Liquorilactobacillus satsumensis DSM 16230 = JCM 12392]